MELPVEIHTPERRAEFLLANAVDADDDRAAMLEVRELRVDPASIPHQESLEG